MSGSERSHLYSEDYLRYCGASMMKSYFDKSGDEASRFLTLGGIAAIDSLWNEIDETWKGVLKLGDPKAEYLHMREAVHLKGEFSKKKGWNHDRVFGLVNCLLSYVTQLPKEKYCQFACTIDMDAYRKLRKETYQLDSPVDICNKTCVESVMQWYLFEYRGLDLQAEYFFDENESFEAAFRTKWQKATEGDKVTGSYDRIWSHIKCVRTAPMRTTPGIQIADMLAWARNREESGVSRYGSLSLALTRLAPAKWVTWSEALLRKHYQPLIHAR